MTPLLVALIVLSSLAIMLSTLSCVLVFSWRKTTPETADLRSKYLALSMDQTDIADKLNHWMARDDARYARSHKKGGKKWLEENEDLVELPAPAAVELSKFEQKQELRKTLLGGRAQ